MPLSLPIRFSFIHAAVVSTGCLLCSTPVAALAGETDRISTDRPDYVDSSSVVGEKHLQIETSVQQERNKRDGIRTRNVSTPILMRYGISKNGELRIQTDGRLINRTDDTGTGVQASDHGAADTALSVKWHLADGEDIHPSLGVIMQADLDTGSLGFRGNGVRPSIRTPIEWELPMQFDVGIMPGLALDRTDAGRRFASASFGVVLGKAWTDNLRTFVELSAPQITQARNGGTQLSFDTGISYLLSNDCQIDTAILRGLNKNTPDTTWTIGFSFRL